MAGNPSRPPRGLVLLCLICTSNGLASAENLPLAKPQVWIASEAKVFGNGAGPERPLDGSTPQKLGHIFEDLYLDHGDYGRGLTIHFLPGPYETGGISVRPRWELRGAGIDKTILKRVATDRDFRLRNPISHVIAGGWGPQRQPPESGIHLAERDYEQIHVSGMTLDCNWDALKSSLGSILKKAAGLSIICKEGLFEELKIINFGAQGGRDAWREVFPIHVRSSLTDNRGAPGYASSFIRIRRCQLIGPVRGPDRGTEWPYCTGIMIGHRDADVVREEVTAIVQENEIRDVTNGHAFGGAHLKTALFEKNLIENCGLGFNFDTGGSQNVIIRSNRFVNCIGGGAVSDGTRFTIEANEIQLRYNAGGRSSWWNTGLRIWNNTRQFRIAGNRITLVPGYQAAPEAETYGIQIHGINVGVRWSLEEGRGWVPFPQPHVLENNEIDPVIANRIGPQDPGSRLFVIINERAIELTGNPGEADGTQYVWKEPALETP